MDMTIDILSFGSLVCFIAGIVWLSICALFLTRIKTDKKYYEIMTDGNYNYKIKFPFGSLSSRTYDSVDEAKKDIEYYYQCDLKALANKKKKWYSVKNDN